MTCDLEIPTFLRRGHPDCVIAGVSSVTERPVPVEVSASKQKLTAAFKGRLAATILGMVNNGHNTFGKLRKALPQHDDRELKSAIRYAKKWIPQLERRGTRAKPQMIQYQARLVTKGRVYEVIKYTQGGAA
tara:strand:- start:64 stop:456 length:393 start_codon:yes stop_codon:yes gene_type:complete